MTRTIILATALLLAPLPAFAQAGTEATATKLVQLMKVEGVLDTMFRQMTPMMTGQILTSMAQSSGAPSPVKARLADAATRKKADAILGDELIKSFRKRSPEIASAIAKEYAATFSEADLQAAIAFYQSPAGQRFIDAQPKLQTSMSRQGQAIGMLAGTEALPAALDRIAALPAPGN